MLECPFCAERLSQQGRDNWFECPSCGNWIRRRINRNGVVWFEAGVFVNGNIQPVQVPQQRPGQAVAARGPTAVSPPGLPRIDQMDLRAVQAERRSIEARLRELENEIRRVYGLRAQAPAGEQLRRYNTELGRCTDEQNRLQERDQRLQEREAALQEEQARARQSGSAGLGRAFLLGVFVAAAVMLAFTRMINLSLDPRAIGGAILIAVGAGIFTAMVALFS